MPSPNLSFQWALGRTWELLDLKCHFSCKSQSWWATYLNKKRIKCFFGVSLSLNVVHLSKAIKNKKKNKFKTSYLTFCFIVNGTFWFHSSFCTFLQIIIFHLKLNFIPFCLFAHFHLFVLCSYLIESSWRQRWSSFMFPTTLAFA